MYNSTTICIWICFITRFSYSISSTSFRICCKKGTTTCIMMNSTAFNIRMCNNISNIFIRNTLTELKIEQMVI